MAGSLPGPRCGVPKWVTFPTLTSVKAFKAERDHGGGGGSDRFDPQAGRTPLSRVWDQYVGLKKPTLSAKGQNMVGCQQAWKPRINPAFGTSPSQRSNATPSPRG